jgi:recombination protein RecA
MIDPNKKEEKLKVIKDEFIPDVEKRFGKGTVFIGHNYDKVPILCSTGSIKMDMALGCYGIPEGRITEIYGPEGSGKTSIALIQAAMVQKAGGIVAFVDAEHALDPIWATKMGVNMNEVLFSQPSCGEEALEIVDSYINKKCVDLIIVDSVAALTPKAELEGDMGDSHMGLHARLMSQAMRKLTHALSESKMHIIFINQIRMRIGITWGSPETTTGGEALKFYASIRLDVRKKEKKIEEGDGQTYATIQVKVVKNKVATPFKTALLTLNTGLNGLYGFDNIAEIMDIAVDKDVIHKAGAWYSYNETKIGQGSTNVCTYLRENPTVLQEIFDKVNALIIAENTPVIGSFNDIVSDIEVTEDEVVNNGEEVKKRGRKRKLEE